jgi:PqqD family protein of HPr-rel-A system
MPGSRYAADAPHLLRKVELDGLTALFHLPSGTTHILAPPAPEILAVLGEGPADADTLLDALRSRYALVEQEGERSALLARLAELEAAGLVQRA